MYALNIDDTGRILSATFPEYAPTDCVVVDALPDGNVSDYLYIDGAFIYDPLPSPEEPSAVDYEARIAELEEQLAAAKILLGVE